MAIDMRVKGCPNISCEMHTKKRRQKVNVNYCPVCGEKTVFVCRRCFREIEDLGPDHSICALCEAKQKERIAKVKETAKNVGKKVATGAVAVVTPIVMAAKETTIHEITDKVKDAVVDVIRR